MLNKRFIVSQTGDGRPPFTQATLYDPTADFDDSDFDLSEEDNEEDQDERVEETQDSTPRETTTVKPQEDEQKVPLTAP